MAIWEIKTKGKMPKTIKCTNISKRKGFTRIKPHRFQFLTVILRVIMGGHEQTFHQEVGLPTGWAATSRDSPRGTITCTFKGDQRRWWEKAEALPEPNLWRESLGRKCWDQRSHAQQQLPCLPTSVSPQCFDSGRFQYAHDWGSEEVDSRIT